MIDSQPFDLTQLTEDIVNLFWSRVNKTDTCWLWIMKPNNKGYGTMAFGHKAYKAHRLAYMIHYGIDPAPKHVLHTCDNTICCNPAHLWVGDNTANVKDKMAKGRYNRIVGSQCGSSILTEDWVKEIKQHLANGHTRTAIAEAYSVSISTVSLISRGKIWKHVTL